MIKDQNSLGAQIDAEDALFSRRPPSGRGIKKPAAPATPTQISLRDIVANAEQEMKDLDRRLPVASLWLLRLENGDRLWQTVKQRSDRTLCQELATHGVAVVNRMLLQDAGMLPVSKVMPASSAPAEQSAAASRDWLVKKTMDAVRSDEEALTRALSVYRRVKPSSVLGRWQNMWLEALKHCLGDESTVLSRTCSRTMLILEKIQDGLQHSTDNRTHRQICVPVIADLKRLHSELKTAQAHVQYMASFTYMPRTVDECSPIAALKACSEQVPTLLRNLLSSIESEQPRLPSRPQQ